MWGKTIDLMEYWATKFGKKFNEKIFQIKNCKKRVMRVYD